VCVCVCVYVCFSSFVFLLFGVGRGKRVDSGQQIPKLNIYTHTFFSLYIGVLIAAFRTDHTKITNLNYKVKFKQPLKKFVLIIHLLKLKKLGSRRQCLGGNIFWK